MSVIAEIQPVEREIELLRENIKADEIHRNNYAESAESCLAEVRKIEGRINNWESRINFLTANSESQFVGWITDREPTTADTDDQGDVAVYDSNEENRWTLAGLAEVAPHGMPWATIESVEHFTEANPAPSPYEQGVAV